jgi:tetratricopeptide (TPR) repeat protein
MLEGRTSGPFRQVRMDTWKLIARYLARSTRTVQRWHREYGLPVHRLGVKTGSIFAYADELDSWLRNRDSAPKNTLFEIPRPALHRLPVLQAEPERSHSAIDAPRIPSSERQQSSALVAFAYKQWESLSNENLKTIAKCFRKAIDLDPGNADAFAGLAHALIAEGLMGVLRIPTAYTSAKAVLDRAVEIDVELPEVKCAAAWLKMLLAKDWHGARRGFDECRSERPFCTRALVGRALLHIAEGCPNEASCLLLQVVSQNPLHAQAAALYCWSRYLAEDYGDALTAVEEARANGQSGPVLDAIEALASIHWLKPNASIRRVENLVADSPHHELLRGLLGYALALNGQTQEADAIHDAIPHSADWERCGGPYAIALLLTGLNRKHEAIQWLDQSYRNGSLWSLGFPSDPIVRSLRDEPGYRAQLGKWNYPAPIRRLQISEGSSSAALEAFKASGT